MHLPQIHRGAVPVDGVFVRIYIKQNELSPLTWGHLILTT